MSKKSKWKIIGDTPKYSDGGNVYIPKIDTLDGSNEGKIRYFDDKSHRNITIDTNHKKISLDEFRPKFSNSNQNIQKEIINKQKFENSKVVQQQKTLETIKNLQEKYREKYEPSQSVKNSKSFLSAGQLAQPLNLPLKAIATGADLETSLRYALDGQYNKSLEDLVQAGVNWIPFLQQEKMLNLSKGLPSLAYRFNEAIPKINQATDYIQKGSDIKTIIEVKKNGGKIPKAGDGKNMGYSWSTQQVPTQQVVGSVENTQTSKPSIQPFQKGYVNPKTMTSKTGEEGLGDDLGGMMVTAALAPGSLPFRASSRLGKVGLEALELANPISGFRGLNSMSSSVNDVGSSLARNTNELPLLNTSSNAYRGGDLDIARYNNMTENINTSYIDPSLQDFHNSIRDRVLNTYNNLPSDEFGFTIHTPPRKQVLKKNIIESSIDAIKNPKRTLAKLQYDYERGALNPKSLYYNQLMDVLPGDKIGKHSLFGDAEKGFKETMNKSAEVSAGRMFGEANLSSDSFPLLLAQLRRKAKDVDITHTGDFVPLNSFGNKSKSLLTAAKNPQEGQESILKYVNEHIDKLNKEVGSKIPYAKVINRRVHIPYILAEKKGATLTDKLQRNKTVGLLGTGYATLAGIKPVFDYADNYNQEKFEKDYNEYIKNKPLQNWEQYPLQQKKTGGYISKWRIISN